MTTATSTTHSPDNAFRGFDQSLERVLGADMRLVYGLAVPILVVVGLIVILALTPAVWLLASIIVLELGALSVVIYGFTGMLRECDGEEEAGLE